MGPALCDRAIPQHNNDIGVVNGAQPVCNKDGRALLFLDQRVDVG